MMLTLGVGQMWGETFTKITSLSDLTTGDYVIVGCRTTTSYGRLTYGTLNNSRIPYSSHYTSASNIPNSYTTTTANEIWHLTVSGTGTSRSVTIYNSGQSKYLNSGISWATSNPTTWIVSYSSGFRFASGSNYLGVNKDANYWKQYGSSNLTSTYGIVLLKAPSCQSWSDPTVNYSATTLTAGGTHATVSSISGTTYGSASYASSNTNILTVNSSTGEVTPVAKGSAKVTVSWAGNATYCAKDVDVNFTVNNPPASITLNNYSGSATTTGYESGESFTLPSTNNYSCSGGKAFVGWSTGEVASQDTKPSSNFYEPGTSVTLGESNTFYAVFANQSEFTRVTDLSQLAAGKVIVVVDNSNTKVLTTTPGYANAPTENAQGKITPAANMIWTLEASSSYWKLKTGSSYLGTTSTDNNNQVSLTPSNSTWEIASSTGADNTFYLRNTAKDKCCLEYNSSTPKWVVYTNNGYTSSPYFTERLYVATRSAYSTDCCQPLGTINGPISLIQSGNDLVANGWGATTGGNETGYLVTLYNSDQSSVLKSGNTAGTAKTYTFENPGAGTYWVSVTPTYSGAGNYCATGDERFSAASIDISGKMVITFKKNGATGTDDQTQEVDYNTETALEDVSARSYTAPSCKEFGGWASSEANATAGTVAYANGANITVTEATTLWAIWKTKTFAVTDGTIASSVASHSYSVNPIACGSDLTITCTAAPAYKGNPTVTATGTHGAITVNSATSVTIANVQSAIAVSIAYNTPKETATVILHDATGAHTQADPYYEADSYTLPNTAATCTESELYGWYTEAYVDQPTAPSGEKYIAKEASKALVAGENHFYAIYATIEDRYTNNYTKITSAGELTNGDYLISSGSYCMKNTVNGARMDEVSISASGNVKSTENTTCVWTITKNGSRVTLFSGEKYLAINSGAITMQAGSYEFTFDYGTTKSNSWTFTSVTEPTQQLSYSGDTKYFRPATSQTNQIDLYKRDKVPSAGAPYTTSPNCTTHDLTSAIDPSSPVSGTVELGKETLVEGKTTKATATPSAHYTFSHWTISGTDASLSDANANPVTVTMGTANAEITAHFTEKPKCTVEFYNNGGSALSSTTYWLGETPEAPTLTDGHDHDACDETSTTHYGWTQTAWTETLTKEQVDAKTAADVKVYLKGATLPAVVEGDNGKTIKYHAVWTKKETSGSEVTKTYGFEDADDASCWTITDAIIKTSGQGATGSYAGKINTNNTYITFNDKVKVTNFSFKLKRTTDNSNYSAIIETSADGSNWSAAETYPLSGFGNGSYTSKSKDFDGETALYVRFHCSNTTAVRYVDDISITYDGVTTTYSAFLTTCIPSHSVSSAVDPTGKATVELGATSVAEGSTTTAEYSAITAGYEFVNWTISGTGASLDDNTANPTTITMGTADVTVTANLQCVKPTFTVHPASKTNYLTTDVATALGYTASAAGASLTQQWQVSADNDSWDDIEGAVGTAETYTPNIATEGTKYYRVIVTNSACGETATSQVATITSIAPSGYCISLFNSNNNGIQSGFSNGGSGNEYTLAFVVPGKDGSNNWPEYWIGENEAWASFSANATIADMKFTSSDATVGLAEGATGTLHIWDDNKTNNLHAKFEPDGYGFRWGDHENPDWTAEACTKAFTVDANNANTYWTELVTLDGTNNTAWDYYVGLQTASGYVYSGVDNEASDARGISRTRSVTAMKVSNGTAGEYKETFLNSEPTGTTGKFRIWNNNITDYNFVCHFVPFYQLKYNANGGSGTMDPIPATPVSCEESAANRTVTVAANAFTAPTGKHFLKWNTAANGSGADVAAGAYELTGDVTLYAIWADADYTVTVNQSPAAGATTTGQTTTAHYNGTINLTTTVPDGYEFVNWTSSDVTITNPTSEDGASFTMPAQNVTVTANFQQIYTITWSINGATTTSTVNAGNKLVLPVGEPASCNAGYSTFIGWYSVAAGTAEDPSDNVSGTKADADHTPTGDETYYAVWANGDLVGGWQKATSIAVGDVVIFVKEGATRELSGVSGNIGTTASYTTTPAGVYPLTVMAGSANNSYAFKNGDDYLSYSGTGNNLYTSETLNAASSWTMSVSDGDFQFTNANSTGRIMQYNALQPRWACYTSTQQTFQIYKQVAGATEFISNCCEEWTATAKYGESNVISVDDVVAVTVTGTAHGMASYESSAEAVLTVAADGKITGVKAGSAIVTIAWAGADGYCAYETTVDVTVNGSITVTYNANDGSLDPETTSQNATSNSAFTLDANSFSRTGYTFQGWATTPSGDKEYNNSQADVEFAEDVILYAVWSINSHAITLNQPTGNTIEATGAADLANVDYGTSITLSATENDGYVFTGWSATGVVLANTNPVVFTMPDNDVTVTATYSTYEWIAADPHYSVATAPKIEYYKVEKFSTAGVVIKENFMRDDDNTITKQETYTDAWTAKLDGVAIANNDALSLEDNGKTLKLYIGEEEIASYTLTVEDVVADRFIDGLWGETFDPQINTYDMPTPSAHAAGVTDCKDHNTFAGWILEANAENPTIENIITGAATTGVTAANNTYYAVWSKSENVNKEFTVSKTGFASSEISSGTISTGITYTTQKNGGSSNPGQTGTSMRLYQILSGQKDGNSITVSGASGVTLTKVEFTTTGSAYGYVTNSYTTGNTTALTSGTVTDGKITLEDLSTDKLTVVNMATSNSYRIDISKIEVTYEKEVTEIDYITDCDPRYDVLFDAGTGATGSYEKVTKKADVEITLPDGSALSKDHHTFAGWYSAHYDVTYSESTSMTYIVPVDGETLVAQWDEDHHAFVHFMNGESEVAGSPIKVYDGGTFDLAAALVEAGKEFIGWKWNGSMYTGGQANQHMDNPAEDRTYTAVWMPVIDVATADAADLSDGKWILIQNKSQLKAGDFIVIAAAGDNAALSKYQKTSNRGDAAVTKIADTLTYTSNVAPLFLQYDPENDYYAFYDRAYTTDPNVDPSQKGYLYAPNALKTQTGITMQGVWAIDIVNKKASIVAQGNNSDKIMRYNKGSNLFNCYGTTTQSDIAIYKWAKNISSDMNVSEVTNTDMVIVKDNITLTINENATLDNLTIENGGTVTVADNKALTINDLTIESMAGKSGQLVKGNDATATVNGNIFMDIKFYGDADVLDETSANQWYMISAPFAVNLADGFINPASGATMHSGTGSGTNIFDLFEYDGSKRAMSGNIGWKRVQGQMPAGMACLIGFNAGQPTTIRLKAASNTISDPSQIELGEWESTVGDTEEERLNNSNWNGVANPTMHYITLNDAALSVQVFENDEENRGYQSYSAASSSFVVGTPFFIHSSSNVDLSSTINGSLRAPERATATSDKYEYCVRITRNGAKTFANQMYVRASEEATAQYEYGHDVATLNGTTAKHALLWTNNYGMRLAVEDAPLHLGKAAYNLGLYAPADGQYTLSTPTQREDAVLYLTLNGSIIWNLSLNPYELTLTRGQNEGYGLLLIANPQQMPTEIGNVQGDNVQCTKVLIDDHIYILRGEKLFDATGKVVK